MFLKHIEEQITNGLETIEGGLQVLSGVAVFPDQFSLMVDDSSSSIKQGIGLYKEGGQETQQGPHGRRHQDGGGSSITTKKRT